MKSSIQSVLDTTAKRFEQFYIGSSQKRIQDFIRAEQLAVLEAVRENITRMKRENDEDGYAFRKQGSSGLAGYDFACHDLLSALDLDKQIT